MLRVKTAPYFVIITSRGVCGGTLYCAWGLHQEWMTSSALQCVNQRQSASTSSPTSLSSNSHQHHKKSSINALGEHDHRLSQDWRTSSSSSMSCTSCSSLSVVIISWEQASSCTAGWSGGRWLTSGKATIPPTPLFYTRLHNSCSWTCSHHHLLIITIIYLHLRQHLNLIMSFHVWNWSHPKKTKFTLS